MAKGEINWRSDVFTVGKTAIELFSCLEPSADVKTNLGIQNNEVVDLIKQMIEPDAFLRIEEAQVIDHIRRLMRTHSFSFDLNLFARFALEKWDQHELDPRAPTRTPAAPPGSFVSRTSCHSVF